MTKSPEGTKVCQLTTVVFLWGSVLNVLHRRLARQLTFGPAIGVWPGGRRSVGGRRLARHSAFLAANVNKIAANKIKITFRPIL